MKDQAEMSDTAFAGTTARTGIRRRSSRNDSPQARKRRKRRSTCHRCGVQHINPALVDEKSGLPKSPDADRCTDCGHTIPENKTGNLVRDTRSKQHKAHDQ